MSHVIKKVMLMNRIGPSRSELCIANADGTGERPLLSESGYDYHANFSQDGHWIVFTSERGGYGKADLYRVHPDGSGLEQLTDGSSVDDQGVLSPDSTQLAWVSTRETHRANIWIQDLATGQARNLTGSLEIQGDLMKSSGFFRPQWSPDGQWIAFTSDRNTHWKTHDENTGWEDLQELSLYVVRPDGSGFRQICEPGIVSGSPKWSSDSKTLIFYEIPVEGSWKARVAQLSKLATSQIISVNLETGQRTELTTAPGLKLSPQFLPGGRFGYVSKAAHVSGIAYSDGASATFPSVMRSPSWSPDGAHVVYQKIDNTPRPQYQPLFSDDPEFEFRYTDVFPSFSIHGELLITSKDTDSSLAVMHKDGSHKRILFRSSTGCTDNFDGPCGAMEGVAFGPNWSKDGEWIVFGFGGYLRMRKMRIAKIMMMRRDGSDLTELTDGTPNAGFPSFSPDGKEIVYRAYDSDGGHGGLRIMDLATREIRVLTEGKDNLPDWSVNGKIVFTRRSPDDRFDIYTIDPDGSNLQKLTDHPASDGHAVWSYDGTRILWNSGIYGFKDEAALYDNTFQPYGQNWIMDPDGSNKRQLTDSPWEDSMPCIVPPYAL